MTTFRVDIDGKTVWSDDFDGTYEEAGRARHFGEYLNRPEDDDTEVYLYVDDVLIGIQRSEANEARLTQED